MANMCTVIAYFYAKTEKLHELEKILQDFVAQTRQEPGCIDYHLHQDDDDPNVFVFYENWRSRGDWGSPQPEAVPEELSREANGLFDERCRCQNLYDAEFVRQTRP